LLVLTKAEKVYHQGHFIDHSRSLENTQFDRAFMPLWFYCFIDLCFFCVFTLSVTVFTAIVFIMFVSLDK